jgi:para-nitrobenzyl esterase
MKANWRSLVRVLATCCGVWTTQGCAGDPPMIDDPQVKGPLVPTAQGTVRGKVDEGAQVFLGIPYAAPPTGANRFAAPKPAAPFAGIYAAGEIGPACPQLSSGKVEEGTSEDCLTLNIWKPTQVSTPRPVLVFLHGGGFVSGSGGLPLYDGKHLSVTQDVVVVTLNYRLGPLGFFAHAALSQQDRSGAGASNFGLLDQQAALAWVRDNIAGFGGDANNVTLFGESAGGMSVCAQLASPRAAGLFHRAIVQSGPCSAIVPRAAAVKVEALDHKGTPVTIEAGGWYARILQHEIDHLDGRLYLDRMHSRSLCTHENHGRHWAGRPIEEVKALLGI